MTEADQQARRPSAADVGSEEGLRAELEPRSRTKARRVLVIAPQPFFVERGTPIAVRYVLDALHQLGFEADVLTLPLGRDIDIGDGQIVRMPNPLGFTSVPVGFSLRKLVFDAFLLADLARRLRARDYACIHAVEEGGLLVLLARGRRRIPLVYDMQSSLPEQLAQKPILRAAPLQAIFRRIEAYLLRHASAVVCSAGLADHARALAPRAPIVEWRFPAARRDVAPEEVAELRRELDVEPETPVVLYTGNFAEYQGVGLLLDALADIRRGAPNAVLVLVGAADQREIDTVHDRLDEDLRAGVRCVLRQPRERIDAFIAMVTILVSPRSYGGNFPLKVFDYLAAGKPIVATDVPTHRVVLDDSLALLVEPRAAACAQGIVRALTDQGLAARLAASARRYADRELSWPRFVALVDDIYRVALRRQTEGVEDRAEPDEVGGN